MTEKKSRIVTIEMLREAAKEYTALRRHAEELEAEMHASHNRLTSLMKRASATTVKAYILGDVSDMNKIPNPNLEKDTQGEK